MSTIKEKNDVYENLNSKQKEIAPKIENLLVGLTIAEAQQLLYKVKDAINETKIS